MASARQRPKIIIALAIRFDVFAVDFASLRDNCADCTTPSSHRTSISNDNLTYIHANYLICW